MAEDLNEGDRQQDQEQRVITVFHPKEHAEEEPDHRQQRERDGEDTQQPHLAQDLEVVVVRAFEVGPGVDVCGVLVDRLPHVLDRVPHIGSDSGPENRVVLPLQHRRLPRQHPRLSSGGLESAGIEDRRGTFAHIDRRPQDVVFGFQDRWERE